MKKTELRKEWAARVAAYKASGQSASAWCAANSLKPRQLWYWLRKYKNIEKPAAKPSRWLSVEVSEIEPNNVQGNTLLVRIGQATLEIKPGFDSAMLSNVVRILAELC
jgi:hypothetical protein